jgi:phage-related protein
MKKSVALWELTCCGHNGDGRLACRCAGRWDKVLWEVRTDLPSNRTARVLICFYRDRLVALHGFIKKTRATPEDDLTLARKRQKGLER